MIKQFNASRARLRRHRHIRRHLAGISSRPRLNVFRSGQHIYAEIIDDSTGMTLVAASSLDESLRNFKLAQPLTTEHVRAAGSVEVPAVPPLGVEVEAVVAAAEAAPVKGKGAKVE